MFFLPQRSTVTVLQRDSHLKFDVRQWIAVGITGHRLIGDAVARILRLQDRQSSE